MAILTRINAIDLQTINKQLLYYRMTQNYTSTLNTYLVGGAVRDQLLGREIVERDY